MPGYLRGLFDSGLLPHGYCLAGRPELIWTHVVSDALIGIAYFSIPIPIDSFLTRRRDMVFSSLIWLFAAFIMCCGLTHFMSIWTLWHPDYGAEALLKALTAIVPVLTAVAIWPLIPRAFALPSPTQLQAANTELSAALELEDAGFEVCQVEDGPSAVALIDEDAQFDAFFTDIRLPGGIDGLRIAEIARARQPGIPVVYASGFSPDPPRLVPGGRFFSKPVRVGAVIEALAALGVIAR